MIKLHPRLMLLTLVFTFFLDNVGLFMVVPIYAPLLLGQHNHFVAVTTSYEVRTILIGFLVAIYGVGQLFGGLLLGDLSDQIGRKKVLSSGLTCLIVGNFLGTYAIVAQQIILLFICRLLTGFASGNWSVIFAAVTDSTPNMTTRNIYFGYLTGAAALGAVVGPLIGGHLPHLAYRQMVSYAIPFVVMACVFILNLLMVIFFLVDTKKDYSKRKLSLTTGFNNLIDCFKMPNINIMLVIFFLFSISSESIFAGLPIFMVEKFRVSSAFIANVIMTGSFVSAITSIYLNKKISAYFDSNIIFSVCLAILFASYIFMLLPTQPIGLFFAYSLFGFSVILVWTHANTIISHLASENIRGKVLGVNQSLCSIAIIVGPTLIGLGAAAHHSLPIVIATLSSFFALILFLLFRRKFID